ncbi:DUF6445 family protein [Aliidiomarina haloalkalitolerans]|uniref:Prolyl 4-hydroxylase alpha subunit Fe(2+) 2OG dioxygenase domain-containing protein n=1 Tax=Aliidiomarina haloalkalitolerans TaxID=859059 RepID=A0A432VPQ3_9GAMM|nr:DUF6445 family protein [Aliidiomarina haloalkalitolerans]RUO18133.1 hypothetical protein CWE06_11735 [Aliidiomarina haloalkalitolerans]
MPTSLIVVDDFFSNAKALREAALKLNYPQVQGPYPGRNSVERINLEGLTEEVSRIVGEPLIAMDKDQAHGKCRIALETDVGKAKVHVDASHWSGILYLSNPEDCRGGTEFFRHKETDTERAPYNDQEAMQRFGAASAKEWVADLLNRDSVDDSKWDMTMRVPMRFNRLILLRPWLWHTAGESFGTTMENGRLVYLMFFRSARG